MDIKQLRRKFDAVRKQQAVDLEASRETVSASKFDIDDASVYEALRDIGNADPKPSLGGSDDEWMDFTMAISCISHRVHKSRKTNLDAAMWHRLQRRLSRLYLRNLLQMIRVQTNSFSDTDIDCDVLSLPQLLVELTRVMTSCVKQTQTRMIIYNCIIKHVRMWYPVTSMRHRSQAGFFCETLS